MDVLRLPGARDVPVGSVDDVLDRFFADSSERAARLDSSYAELWDTIRANTSGGKRFRPRLVLMAHEHLGGADPMGAAHVAAAFELLHTALIVHDDVIDRDFVRRGGPNVSGRYRDVATTAGISLPIAEHRGMSIAVIAGDLALTGAHRLIERCGASPAIRDRLLDLLDDAIFASAGGELIDVEFSLRTRPPELEAVIDMERLKTAVYSFEAPLAAGATLAGAADATVADLARIGRSLGIAYQLVDDLLGVFGDASTTGKTVLGDLREGKQTALMAYARGTEHWDRIAPLIGRADLCEEDAATVRAALDDCGARRSVERLASEYGNRAWEALAKAELPDSLADRLRPMVTTVLERTR